MSDTSGRVSYEPQIRRVIKEALDDIDVRARGKGSRTPRTGKGRSGKELAPGGDSPSIGAGGEPISTTPAPLIIDPVPQVVWSTLQARGVLGEAFESEVIAYLKRLAEFIEISSSAGMDGVKKRFNVEPDSGLLRLQRIIREEVESKATTQFGRAAKRAFHIGSINWAKKLLHVSDPLRIKIGKLMEAVARNPDFALILSPTLILKEYGRRLLESALPGGDTNKRVVDNAIKSFIGHFEIFMAQHKNPDEWRSDTLASTVRQYENLLTTPK